MHTHKITWHILGTGAIGCLWASKFLQQAIPCVLLHRHTEDQEVTDKSVASKNFVPKPAVSKTLTITHLDKSQSQYKVPTQSIADTAEIRYLLVCTKSYQTQVAIESIQSRLSTAATIVLLQNGMGQQQLISERLPNHLIIAATTTEGALVNTAETTNIALENRLSISHTGAGVSYFGCLIENPALVPKVIYSLQAIGMQKDDNISRLLWQKLAINCVINPLTAKHNCRNG
jgi:2-dehydropantoate 2-reductase